MTRRKLNLHTLALWAALPMARTAQVESRLQMILKPGLNRRTLTRRAVLLALVPATAAVGIIAALRPAAIAEAALFQHTFPNGAFLERGAGSGTGKTAAPLVLTLRYALNSQPQAVWTAAPDFKEDYLSQGNGVYLRQPILWTWGSGGSLQTKMPPETVTTAAQGTARYQFPVKPETAISPLFVGVAAGPWTLSVDGPNKTGKVYLAQPSGQVIWTLVRHKHQDGALLMVSDHFRTHSPFPAENDVQVAFYDAENCQRVIYALDKKGQVLSELYGTRLTTPDEDYQSKDYYQSIKTQQTIHIPSALLRRTAKFRLVARPYEWTKLAVGLQSAKR